LNLSGEAMPIIVAPNIPQVTVQNLATAADIVLQPGSVITAQVVQIFPNDQVRIAIGGQSIDVSSQLPLQVGQTLQLQVSQTAGGIGLSLVNPQGAPGAGQNLASATSITLAPDAAILIATLTPPGASATNNQLTPVEALAVSLAAQSAATQQTSLAPLFANLAVAATLPGFPPQVREAIAQVLAQTTNLDQNLSGNDIQQAFRTSGLFLETSLASESTLPSNSPPDLKAALIVLRQALTTSLASVVAPSTAGAATTTPATPQGATAPTAQPSLTPPEVTELSGVPAAGTAAATVAQQASALAIAAPTQTGQPAVQALPQGLTIIAGSDVPATATSAAAAARAAPAIAQAILDLAASSQIVAPASAPADAAARAALSGTALNLLQEVLQTAGPPAPGNPSSFVLENGEGEELSLIPAVTGTRAGAIDDAEFSRTNPPPPPINGALPAAQPVAAATLAARVPLEATLQHLLADTDGALARQTLLQIASLPGQVDPTAARVDASAPRWNFEIPFATPQGTAVAQFEISRDGGGNAVEPAKRIWRARFSLNVEPAGPVHALVSLNGERTSVRMWAERSATASQLRAGVSQLNEALSRADLQPGDIIVRDGAPTQPAPAPAGHFLNRAL
jgi:Flagellar hook-length control protein FliK